MSSIALGIVTQLVILAVVVGFTEWLSQRWMRRTMSEQMTFWSEWATSQADSLDHVVHLMNDMIRRDPQIAETVEVAKLEVLEQQKRLRYVQPGFDAIQSGSLLRLRRVLRDRKRDGLDS